jgi:hypothetical protein
LTTLALHTPHFGQDGIDFIALFGGFFLGGGGGGGGGLLGRGEGGGEVPVLGLCVYVWGGMWVGEWEDHEEEVERIVSGFVLL